MMPGPPTPPMPGAPPIPGPMAPLPSFSGLGMPNSSVAMPGPWVPPPPSMPGQWMPPSQGSAFLLPAVRGIPPPVASQNLEAGRMKSTASEASTEVPPEVDLPQLSFHDFMGHHRENGQEPEESLLHEFGVYDAFGVSSVAHGLKEKYVNK